MVKLLSLALAALAVRIQDMPNNAAITAADAISKAIEAPNVKSDIEHMVEIDEQYHKLKVLKAE